jgi:hypothetical protein
MLARTPESSDVVLVRVGREDPAQWAHNVEAIEQAVGRSVQHLAEPVPRSPRIAEAHNGGLSVWTLPRRGRSLHFLAAVEVLAKVAWSRIPSRGVWPDPPQPATAGVYVSGWDDEA